MRAVGWREGGEGRRLEGGGKGGGRREGKKERKKGAEKVLDKRLSVEVDEGKKGKARVVLRVERGCTSEPGRGGGGRGREGEGVER